MHLCQILHCSALILTLDIHSDDLRWKVLCEILERDGLPEFRVTLDSNGQSYWASSESSVWKKVRTISMLLLIFVMKSELVTVLSFYSFLSYFDSM